jgi:hypothetical protein
LVNLLGFVNGEILVILYHGTTGKRAKKIFEDGKLKCFVERHYTLSKSGDGYTEQGYVYLTNEMMFAIYFANCCDLEDNSGELYVFKIDMEDSLLEPDYDEIRIQHEDDFIRKEYPDDLEYSLKEFKSCRVKCDIDISNNKVLYLQINKNDIEIGKLIEGAGYNLKDTQNQYNSKQKIFIKNANWKKIL